MNLLLIRHALAEPRVEDGGTQTDDGLRALTRKGKRRMRRAARGLVVAQPDLDILATSPLVRATQTAEIVADAYDALAPTSVPELQPGAGLDAVLAWLRRIDGDVSVAAVGHEPDLGILASYLVSGHQDPFVQFGKGGACLLHVPAGVIPGSAILAWLLAARHLRRLGR